MAKAPIKERIVVFRYNALHEEAYRSICDALSAFLLRNFQEESFTKQVMHVPEVTLPAPTFDSVEPDWKSLRVAIDRPSRFWSSDKMKCVQFFKDRLTVNLISSNDDAQSSHKDLFAFFNRLLPFFQEHGRKFEKISAGIDYQNVLYPDQLARFTTNGGHTLELQRILRAQILGQEIDGAIFASPVIHKFAYVPKPNSSNSFPARLSVEIVVQGNNGKDWCMTVLLSATGEFPGFAQTLISKFLEDMHEAVSKGFYSTFTDELTRRPEASK